jgi:hypothetical protein
MNVGACVEKSFQEGTAALQISPLQCALSKTKLQPPDLGFS